MDFSTTHSPPLPVTIDGTRYSVPRFRMPHFNAWVADASKKAFDEAVAYLTDPEHKARFRLYYSSPLIDVADLANELRTPEGIARVLHTCLEAAGATAEVVDKLIDNEDPMALRALAKELASTQKAAAELEERSGDGGKGSDPTNAASAISGAAPSTGDSSQPASPASSDPAPQTA
jgi:hypothetical protein